MYHLNNQQTTQVNQTYHKRHKMQLKLAYFGSFEISKVKTSIVIAYRRCLLHILTNKQVQRNI